MCNASIISCIYIIYFMLVYVQSILVEFKSSAGQKIGFYVMVSGQTMAGCIYMHIGGLT